MKRLWILALVFPLLFTACGEDECPDDPLSYDSGNVTGPVLPAGIHEFAVRFTEDELCGHLGNSLSTVQFFIGQAPSLAEVVIYGDGGDSRPGAELYAQNVTNAIQIREWTNHLIVNPIEITGEDLWIAIRVAHVDVQNSVGCDNGPNQEGGDWLLRADDGRWLPFTQRTSESVNWNIRGIVE